METTIEVLTDGRDPGGPRRWPDVSQDPAVDRAVLDLDATLEKQLFEISNAERIAKVPCHRLHDQPCLAVPPFQVIL